MTQTVNVPQAPAAWALSYSATPPLRVLPDYDGANGIPVRTGPKAWDINLEPDPGTTLTPYTDFTAENIAGVSGLAFRVRPNHDGVTARFPAEVGTTVLPWVKLDNGPWVRGPWSSAPIQSDQSFVLSPPTVTANRMQIAGAPAYDETEYALDRAAWEDTGFCRAIAYGTSPGGRPLYRHVVAADPFNVPAGRKVFVLVACEHGAERFQSQVAKGFLDWATGPTSDAVTFRARHAFVVYLRPNPDGYAQAAYQVGIVNRYPATPHPSNIGYVFDNDLYLGLSGAWGMNVRGLGNVHTSGAQGIKIADASGAFSSLPISTFNLNGRFQPVDTAVWETTVENQLGSWLHRRIRERHGLPTWIIDTSAWKYIGGEVGGVDTARWMGKALAQMHDAWLVSH